jgi:hypothetical protein
MKQEEQPDTTRLRRFTPDDIQKFMETRTPHAAAGLDDTPHIVFPKGAKFTCDFEPTHSEMEAISSLLFAGMAMREAQAKFESLARDGAQFQFFGKWDLLRIRSSTDRHDS